MNDLSRPLQPVPGPDEALFRLFQGLHRKGPGLEACTLRALAACRPLPRDPTVLDLGCGAGASTLVLAKALGATITAVDACADFLEELEHHARLRSLSGLVRPLCLDFGAPGFQPGVFDLLWSEGAIYNLGWAAGLKAWKPLVRPGGFLALTEAVWFTDHPPENALAAWSRWYPAMGTMDHCLQVAESLGLEAVEAFALPPESWQEYYEPLEQRCRDRAPGADPALAQVIAETLEEIRVYQASGDAYGYAFFVLRAP